MAGARDSAPQPPWSKPQQQDSGWDEDLDDDLFFDVQTRPPTALSGNTPLVDGKALASAADGWDGLDLEIDEEEVHAPSRATAARAARDRDGGAALDSNRDILSRDQLLRTTGSLRAGSEGGGMKLGTGTGTGSASTSSRGSGLHVSPLSADELFSMLNDKPPPRGNPVKLGSTAPGLSVPGLEEQGSGRRGGSAVGTAAANGVVPSAAWNSKENVLIEEAALATPPANQPIVKSRGGLEEPKRRGQGRLQAKKMQVGGSTWDDF